MIFAKVLASEKDQDSHSVWSYALFRLRQNKVAMFGFWFLVLLIAVSVLTPWIAPYEYDAIQGVSTLTTISSTKNNSKKL